MDQDAGVGKGVALPGPPGQDDRRGRGGLPVTERRYVVLDELHGVVDGEQGRDVAAGLLM